MAEVAVDEMALRAVLGPRLVERPLEWLVNKAESADANEAETVWERARRNAGRVAVPDKAGLQAACYYLALREFTRDEELSAFTVECYPELMGQVCLPIALLAEEDVVGACEGDVNSAVAMRLLSWFAGGPVHNTDLLADDPEENTIVFSHCGSGAFCLAASQDDIVLDSCRLMYEGVTVQYPGRPGRVTGVNLVGPSGDYRLGLFGGDAVPTELVFPGNPVKVRLDVPVADFLEGVAEAGLGHHWMIGEGDALPAFREFGRLTGIPVFQPGLGGK
jgi:L-arabinose isomerase